MADPPPLAARADPGGWHPALWTVLAVLADGLQVEYTVGGFTFAPAIALMAGSWAGARRGAASQAAAVGILLPLSLLSPWSALPSDWGFRVGRIGAAWVAGQVARADGSGAVASRRIRATVASAAVATGLVVVYSRSHFGPGVIGTYFALTFLMAAVIAAFYARRLVPEPARVVNFLYCLLPYYAAGLGTTWALALYDPALAGLPGPGTSRTVLFHAFLTQLPGDLLAIVLVAVLVGSVRRSRQLRASLEAADPADRDGSRH